MQRRKLSNLCGKLDKRSDKIYTYIRMCWPAYIVGLFFILLIIFDIIQKQYSLLVYHGIIGVCVTGLLWGVCILAGESIAMATLVVPLIFISIYLLHMTSYEKIGHFVKRDSPKSDTCIPKLTSTIHPPEVCPEPPPEPPCPEPEVCPEPCPEEC